MSGPGRHAPTRSDARRLLAVMVLLSLVAGGPARPAFRLDEVPGDAPAATGALEGVVRLAGDSLPRSTRVSNTTDPGVCDEDQSLEDLLVSARGRGVANVIVALTDVSAGGIPPHAPRGLTLDNVDCRFRPHASVAVVGDTIVAVNRDALLHTVHLYGAAAANLSLPRAGIRRAVVADRPGMVIVKCDVHGWMQAFVRVDPQPYHAVSDAEGAFRIEGIPEGEHAVELWHERLGTVTRVVRIVAGQTTTLDAEYVLERDR